MEGLELAMDELITQDDGEKSPVDDREYFDLNLFALDNSMGGTPITPVTKYVKSSSNILVELRKQKGAISRSNSGSSKTSTHLPYIQGSGQDENVSPCSPNISKSASPMILQKLRDHRSESTEKRAVEEENDTPRSSAKKRVKSIPRSDSHDYSDYIQSVRNSMNVTVSSRNGSITSAHDGLSESCIDYGSPGSFLERAKAFSFGGKVALKSSNGQVIILFNSSGMCRYIYVICSTRESIPSPDYSTQNSISSFLNIF